MEREMYLITSKEDSHLIRDAILSIEVADLNRKEPIDVIFLHPNFKYPILRSYCRENKTYPIQVRGIDYDENHIADGFLEILGFSKKEPFKKRFIHIPESEHFRRLEELFKSANFSVKSYIV